MRFLPTHAGSVSNPNVVAINIIPAFVKMKNTGKNPVFFMLVAHVGRDWHQIRSWIYDLN
jgi:hypothetical protein